MIQIQALQTIETIQQHHPSLLTPMLHQVFSYMIQTFGSKNSPMATTILPAQTLYHSISNLCLLKAQPSNDVYIMMDQLIRNELICINNNNHDNNNSSTIEYNFRKWEEWVPSMESLQGELEQMKNQMQATVKLLRKFSYLTILKSIKSKLVENGLINNTFISSNNNNNNNSSSRRDILVNNGTILPLQKSMLVYWFRQFCTFCIPVAPQQVIQYLSQQQAQQQNAIMLSLRVEPIMRNNCCDMIKISFPPSSSLSSSLSNQLSQANNNSNNNNNNKENVQVVNTSTTISMNNSVQYQYNNTPMNNLLKPSQTVQQQQQNQQQQYLQGDYTNCCMMMTSNPSAATASAIQQKKCKRKYSATSMMMTDDEQPSDNGVVVVSQLLAPDSNKRIRLF